jgi:hypothetical protein
MQVRCIKAFAAHKPGDVAEVPDGAEVSPVYFEPLTAPAAPATPPDPPPAAPAAPAGTFSQPKGM